MVLPSVINIPAFWEMRSENYEYIKSLRLDSVKNAKLIEKVEKVRNGFMSHISETLYAQQKKESAFR